jgi:cleavage stimulation factor subunit 3
MTAKEVLKQLRSHLAILFPPPAHSHTTGRKPLNLPEPTSPHSEGHRMLAKSWRAYLQWEEKNPLDIEDKPLLTARLLATYKKAVIRMRFNPETW